MARSILYWKYAISSIDAHGDIQHYTNPWHDSQVEAEAEAEAYAADLAMLGHTDIGVTVVPVYGAEVPA